MNNSKITIIKHGEKTPFGQEAYFRTAGYECHCFRTTKHNPWTGYVHVGPNERYEIKSYNSANAMKLGSFTTIRQLTRDGVIPPKRES